MTGAIRNADWTAAGWRVPEAVPPGERPPAPLWDWLTESGSLTARLRGHCGADFRLVLLDESRRALDGDEARRLAAGGTALCREVTLNCGARPLVYARSLLPEACGGAWFEELGETPLGDALFARPETRRGRIELTRLEPGTPLYRRAARHGRHPAWARRSLIRAGELRLLILECFYTPV